MINSENFLNNFYVISRHHKKLIDFIYPELIKIKNGNILEFGVSERATSTELFLEYSINNGCKLFSVDNVDYSKKFKDSSWKFIFSRDDNFDFVKQNISDQFDLILLDTIHEANHVENILFNYFEKLKINSSFFIDDISWLPYLKTSEKNRFYNEINNYETFERLLHIYNSNRDNIEIDFTFSGTGMCKIKKLNSGKLNPPKIINTRVLSVKNLFRKLLKS